MIGAVWSSSGAIAGGFRVTSGFVAGLFGRGRAGNGWRGSLCSPCDRCSWETGPALEWLLGFRVIPWKDFVLKFFMADKTSGFNRISVWSPQGSCLPGCLGGGSLWPPPLAFCILDTTAPTSFGRCPAIILVSWDFHSFHLGFLPSNILYKRCADRGAPCWTHQAGRKN